MDEIQGALVEIERKLTKAMKNELIQCEVDQLSRYHFGLGTWIRNHCLTSNDALYHAFMRNGITEKDDMSKLFIEWLQYDLILKKNEK